MLTGLCLGVVKLPEDIVFGRVLPALGIALPIGNLFYAWLAWQLAKREGRDDVTALPYGPSVPHMFIVVFLVMLPTYLKTQDPILAWQAGLAWAFIIGIIILLGAFVGPTIRKYTPRAAMLGALAGISIAFISMRPAALSWQVPWLAFISLGIILVSWCARVRLPWGLPGGLAGSGGRDRARLARHRDRTEPGDGSTRRRPRIWGNSVCMCRFRLATSWPGYPTSARCWSSRCRLASTTSRRA